jgi:hypothetical protein
MANDITIGLIGAGAAVTGGLLTGAYEHFRDWLARPQLTIDYVDDSSCNVTSSYEEEGKEVTGIYVRARVRNVGKRIARKCRVFLIGIDEVQHGGTTKTAFHDSMPLCWPIRDFLPRDIPRGINSYINIVYVMKHRSGWNFGVESLLGSHTSLTTYRGTYQLTLLATADNADPFQFVINVIYDQDWHSFRAIPAS